MKSIFVNFLSDIYLENLVRSICSNHGNKIYYLFDHKKPDNDDQLSKIHFLDCTYLYDVKNFPKAFINISKSSFSFEETKQLEEGLVMVLKSLDRITPFPVSNVENEDYFWELASYFKSFILKIKDLSSIVFDNIPHMPWDLTLFYIAKIMNVKTLILRRTNIGGVSYICEDFRPNKLNYKFKYINNTNDIFKSEKNLDEKINILRKSEFAKSQIDGIWPEEFKDKKKINNFFGDNLTHYLSIFYSLIKVPKLQTLGANKMTFLNSTFSRQRSINRLNFFKLKKDYRNKLRKLIKEDEKFSKNLKNLQNINYIFFPLHFQPERSTLPEGYSFDKQYMAIRLLSENIDNNLKIIVKDHPKQYYSDLRNHFYRNEDYLKKISEINNVIVVSRNHNYKQLLDNALITASISGSVTWQGLLIGKPGITFSDTWLSDCESVLTMFNIDNVKSEINKLLIKNNSEVFQDIINFVEKNNSYFIDTVVYSKHLRFFDFKEKIPLENLKKYLLQRI